MLAVVVVLHLCNWSSLVAVVAGLLLLVFLLLAFFSRVVAVSLKLFIKK